MITASKQVVIYAALQFGKTSMRPMHMAVKPEDVFEGKPDERKLGYEDEPHVTIIYGHGYFDSDKIPTSEEINGNIKFALTNCDSVTSSISNTFSFFETEAFDVVIMKASSELTAVLNAFLVSNYDINQNYEHNPHMTVAYVKKGLGSKYNGMYIQHGISSADCTGIKICVRYDDDNGAKINDETFISFDQLGIKQINKHKQVLTPAVYAEINN